MCKYCKNELLGYLGILSIKIWLKYYKGFGVNLLINLSYTSYNSTD